MKDKKIINNPSMSWNIPSFGFKNRYKVYGSVMFDAIYENMYDISKIHQYLLEIFKPIL